MVPPYFLKEESMAFTDSEKAAALKEAMCMAVNAGTDWNVLKAEFFALSEAFQDETLDFMDRMKSLSELSETTSGVRKDNLGDLIEELGE